MASLRERIARLAGRIEALARSGRVDPMDAEFSNVLGAALVAHHAEAVALQQAIIAFLDQHPGLSGAELVEAPGFMEAVGPLFDQLVEADEGLSRFLAERAQDGPGDGFRGP